jgi:stage V sporulation protein B
LSAIRRLVVAEPQGRVRAAYAFGAQILSAGVTAVLTIYLARALSPDAYGTFALALSVASLALIPADFGIAPATARFVAELRSRPARAAAAVGSGLRLKARVTTAVCVIVFVAAGPIAVAYADPALGWPLRWFAVMVLFQSSFLFCVIVAISLGRTQLQFLLFGLESLLELSLTVALVASGQGAAGAAFARAAAYGGGFLLAFLALRAVLGGTLGLRERELAPSGLARYASAILIVDAAFALYSQVDVLLIGALRSARDAGLFQAPLRLIAFTALLAIAVSNITAPRLSAETDPRAAAALLVRSCNQLLVVYGLVTTLVVVWAEPLTRAVLGVEYLGSVDALRALAPAIALTGLSTLFSVSANYLGEARSRIPIVVVALVANLVIDLLLIPDLGIVAGAIGTGVALLIYAPGHLWICAKRLPISSRAIVSTLGKTAIAAAASGLLLFAVGTSQLSVFGWIGGTLGGTGVYLGVLTLLREPVVRAAPRMGRRGSAAFERST